MKSIKVNEKNWEKLMLEKVKTKATSINDVIGNLLRKKCKGEKKS
jgi:predicted CopG family antitoxin